MNDIMVGLIALVVGLIVTFAGYAALRAVIALFGAFAGFGLGAALGASIPVGGVAGTVTLWLCALLGALLLGWLAYAFYQVGVLLGLASIGFSLGVALMLALGAQSGWLVWTVGALVAVVLVVVGLIGDLPAILLIVLTALAGANLVVTGVMLMTGTVSLRLLEAAGSALPPGQSWWWGLGSLVLAAFGMIAQLRSLRRARSASMRAQWSGAR
jgi:hypothetical protein